MQSVRALADNFAISCDPEARGKKDGWNKPHNGYVKLDVTEKGSRPALYIKQRSIHHTTQHTPLDTAAHTLRARYKGDKNNYKHPTTPSKRLKHTGPSSDEEKPPSDPRIEVSLEASRGTKRNCDDVSKKGQDGFSPRQALFITQTRYTKPSLAAPLPPVVAP